MRPCAVNMNLVITYCVQCDMHIYENNKDMGKGGGGGPR